jgi:flagellar protein FlaJ
MYFKPKYKNPIYMVSIVTALVLFSLIILQGRYVLVLPYIIPLDMKVNYAFALCILIAIVPPAIVELNNSIWLKQVDKNIPRLMMDLTESIRSGMPLVRALEVAATRNYGPITAILETTVVNFNLTSDLEGSLKWFGESLLRPSGKRMATILQEAYKSGGRMLEVLDTSIRMFTNLDEYKEEKQSTVSPYVLLVYASTLIFLFIGWVVIQQFILPLTKTDPSIPGVGNLIGKMLPLNYYKAIVFWAAVMEGLIGGFVAGKITDSRIASGLIHSVLLILITYGFYTLFL